MASQTVKKPRKPVTVHKLEKRLILNLSQFQEQTI